MKRIYLTFLLSLPTLILVAQNSYEDFRNKLKEDYSQYKQKSENEYTAFRNKVNQEYADFLEKSWKSYNGIKGESLPKEDTIPPVICPIEDLPAPTPKPLPFDDIIPAPLPVPKPQPIVPIDVAPTPEDKYFNSTEYFNQEVKVRLDETLKFKLNEINEKAIAEKWRMLSDGRCDKTISDFLNLRSKYNLCDWAYLLLIKTVCEEFYGYCGREETLLVAYIYCQSGYKMRLAIADDTKLEMLFASDFVIFDKTHFILDGHQYYPLTGRDYETLYICDTSFPGEKSLSLIISSEMNFTFDDSTYFERNVKAGKYPEINSNVVINKNLIDFMDTYPCSKYGNNMCTQWSVYADTPISKEVRNSLYPTIKKAIEGDDEVTAANKILNFVQTAFVYEYDNKVWGHDRAFFADETLFYPYSDCEDRSILFSRIVRDLLGLDVLLVYYPGHLATAVNFSTSVNGDYIELNGTKYTVCDPTYTNANVGITMPKMDNSTAKVILLNNKH